MLRRHGLPQTTRLGSRCASDLFVISCKPRHQVFARSDIYAEGQHPMIRSVTSTDIPELKAVIDGSGLFPSAMLDDMIAGFLSGEAKDEFWLTVDEAGPKAIAYYAPEPMTQGTWNLLLIAVHPDHQGKGHGTALIHYIEQVLAVRGERMLLVETSGLSSFERTHAFYDKLGYGREARIRDYYNAGEDMIMFRKAIPAG